MKNDRWFFWLFLLGLAFGLTGGFYASDGVSKMNQFGDIKISGTRFSVMDQAFLGKEHLTLIMDDSTKTLYLYSSGGCMIPYSGNRKR